MIEIESFPKLIVDDVDNNLQSRTPFASPLYLFTETNTNGRKESSREEKKERESLRKDPNPTLTLTLKKDSDLLDTS